eukprot:TRINITY_DN22078_c1_g1_i3.p1 TRINITY_DN22078_c1_g1~~TRINITY_DN22078_c1_g1_i3.p1  ORF type:complete len:322 (-),score=23.61 TRINITY_DN22078_c1_g1_i3:15-980(-)
MQKESTKNTASLLDMMPIFSPFEFIPFTGDNMVVSCGLDDKVRLNNIEKGVGISLHHHTGSVKRVIVNPNSPNSIISCSEDGTVKSFDRRYPKHVEVLVNLRPYRKQIFGVACSGLNPWLLAVGSSDEFCRIYDRRMNDQCVSMLTPRSSSNKFFSCDGVSGLEMSWDGRRIIASYQGDYVYMFNLEDEEGLMFTPEKQSEKKQQKPSCSNHVIQHSSDIDELFEQFKRGQYPRSRKQKNYLCKQFGQRAVTLLINESSLGDEEIKRQAQGLAEAACQLKHGAVQPRMVLCLLFLLANDLQKSVLHLDTLINFSCQERMLR